MSNNFTCRLFVAAILWLSISIIATAGELRPAVARKLDPHLRNLINKRERSANPLSVHPALLMSDAGSSVRVLVKTTGTMDELRANGARIISVVGNIAAAVAPIDRLDDLASLNDVVYIESSKWLNLLNDVGTVQSGGKAAQQPFNKGKGVIVGVLDSGIDWRHPDFRNDDGTGTTRIKFLLDLSDPGDTNGDGMLDGTGPFGGTLYTEAQINSALSGSGNVAEVDRNGHGTHVTGSAAGNGLGTGGGIPAGTYAGMAPEADIIFVKSQTGDLGKIPDTDVLSALEFIDSLATQMAQPYVASFNFGTHEGPHDGTSLFEKAVDRFVVSTTRQSHCGCAGNEGEKKIHAGVRAERRDH
jgi:hypothetical protein